MAWKLAQRGWTDEAKLDAFLADSWEPFAITDGGDGAIVWLRRSAAPDEARIVESPRGPRHEPEVT